MRRCTIVRALCSLRVQGEVIDRVEAAGGQVLA
jgi:hypothetical protein